LLNNPYGEIAVESIDLDIEVGWDTNIGEIVGLALPASSLKPGKRNYAQVRIEPFQGKSFLRRIPFDVPKELAGSIVRLEVTAGDSASLYVAPPKTTGDLVEAFRSLLPGTVFAVTLYSADVAAAIDGKLIQDLPSSALNRLRATSRTPGISTRQVQARSVFPATQVIEGGASLLVKVGNL
jgi:hypothetical protein